MVLIAARLGGLGVLVEKKSEFADLVLFKVEQILAGLQVADLMRQQDGVIGFQINLLG
jgi:hypothetical protein